VGTGYFLDRCRFPSQSPRIGLLDLNPNVLQYASQRIARYKPETYCRNVLEPIFIDAAKFDSVAVNYLLHCVPGCIESKAVAFDHLKALMNPNAVLFGSTAAGRCAPELVCEATDGHLQQKRHLLEPAG
jgi:hypothetical protein